MTRPSVNILSVNTADQGGGAEQFAGAVSKSYLEQGASSRLLVGDAKSERDDVVSLWRSPYFDYRPFDRPAIEHLRNIRKLVDKKFGIEDFHFPYSHYLEQIAGFTPDVIHLHNLHGGFFDLRSLIGLSRKYPVIWTLHDLWALTGHCAYPIDCQKWKSGCGGCPDLKRHPAIQRDATRFNFSRKNSIYSQLQLYVASSSNWVLEQIPGSSIEQATVESRKIPYGIDLKVFKPGDKKEARRRLGLPEDSFLVMFAAVNAINNPYKDFSTVFNAANLLRENLGSNTELLIAGCDGKEKDAPGVHQLNFIEDREVMADYYRAADLYLHAAKSEVFGLVMAEALACGTPVVATGVGGIPEVFRDGIDGILVPPGDHVSMAKAAEAILTTPGRLEVMSRAATDWAHRNYDIDECAGAYLSWFNEILERQRIPQS